MYHIAFCPRRREFRSDVGETNNARIYLAPFGGLLFDLCSRREGPVQQGGS